MRVGQRQGLMITQVKLTRGAVNASRRVHQYVTGPVRPLSRTWDFCGCRALGVVEWIALPVVKGGGSYLRVSSSDTLYTVPIPFQWPFG